MNTIHIVWRKLDPDEDAGARRQRSAHELLEPHLAEHCDEVDEHRAVACGREGGGM